MTQEDQSELRILYDMIDNTRLTHESTIRTLTANKDAIIARCDHKYADDTSAVAQDFIDDVCLICHRSV